MVSRLDAMRDTGRETALHRGRLMVVLLATLLAFGLLIYRYYTLQILEYEQFLTESDRNRVRLEALPPTRGLILDRKGRLLAANEPSRSLGVIVERAGNLGRLMDKIDALVGLDVDDRERFQERRRKGFALHQPVSQRHVCPPLQPRVAIRSWSPGTVNSRSERLGEVLWRAMLF